MKKKKEGVFDYQTLTERERRNLAILDIIRRNGSISRTEISRMIGINIVTISNYVRKYIQNGLILEKELDISSGGRRPTLFELNVKSGYVIGLDIGPANIIGIMADLGINKIVKVKHPRPNVRHFTSISMDILYELMDNPEIERDKIKGIGLGISGVIDEASGIVRDTAPSKLFNTNSYVALKNAIAQEFGISAYIGNDATCAVYGEKMLNREADAENILYIYSDVGCGIIIKGEVYAGASGSAGEIQISLDTLSKEKLSLPSELYYLRPRGLDLGMVEDAKKIIRKGASTKILELTEGDAERVTLDIIIKAAQN